MTPFQYQEIRAACFARDPSISPWTKLLRFKNGQSLPPSVQISYLDADRLEVALGVVEGFQSGRGHTVSTG